MKKPIALLGLPGCGKTFWGKALADHLGIAFYDLDQLISRQSGLSITEIFHEGGEALFRSIETSTLYELSNNTLNENFILALGGGTPAFNDNMGLVNAKYTSIYLSKSIESICDNLIKDTKNHRPLVRKTSRMDLTHYIEKLHLDRKISYELAHYMLIDEEISISNLEKIIKDVK